jgi:Immunity protein 63
LLSLAEIKSEVDDLAQRIGASGFALPTYGHSEDFARPHIEVDDRRYYYVVVERGEELSRFTTSVLDELLYRVFESVTFTLAFDYELKHRVAGQDRRRVGFQRQTELLSALSPEWVRRSAQEHSQTLQ